MSQTKSPEKWSAERVLSALGNTVNTLTTKHLDPGMKEKGGEILPTFQGQENTIEKGMKESLGELMKSAMNQQAEQLVKVLVYGIGVGMNVSVVMEKEERQKLVRQLTMMTRTVSNQTLADVPDANMVIQKLITQHIPCTDEKDDDDEKNELGPERLLMDENEQVDRGMVVVRTIDAMDQGTDGDSAMDPGTAKTSRANSGQLMGLGSEDWQPSDVQVRFIGLKNESNPGDITPNTRKRMIADQYNTEPHRTRTRNSVIGPSGFILYEQGNVTEPGGSCAESCGNSDRDENRT
jgi:hypothetical protein